MPRTAPDIGKVMAGLRDEFPIIAIGIERQLEHAEGHVLANFAIRNRGPDPVIVLAAGPDNEFTDAACPVERTIRVLRREPLVIVIVTGNDHLGTGFVERAPDI